MQIVTKGKNLSVSPSLRALAEQKIARLERYLPGLDFAEVEFSLEHARSVVDREIVQVTLEVDGRVLRAEQRAGEMRVALDSVVDQLRNQLKDLRTRERTAVRRGMVREQGLGEPVSIGPGQHT